MKCSRTLGKKGEWHANPQDPPSSLCCLLAVAKWAAIRGEEIKSKTRVDKPLCCATARRSHPDLRENVPTGAYFPKARKTGHSTCSGVDPNLSKLVLSDQDVLAIPLKEVRRSSVTTCFL
jgi:hypothetical protein